MPCWLGMRRRFAPAIHGSRSTTSGMHGCLCNCWRKIASGNLGAFAGTEGSTAVADPSPQTGTHSRAGEERVAAPGDESRRFEEAEVVEPSGREGAPRVTACAVGQPAARRPVQGKRDVEWAD